MNHNSCYSLTNLANFIREADEGMLQPVEEGDYNGLVNVMAYLMNVKERQEITNEMFEPLKETIALLRFYDQDISEEVNVLLQVPYHSSRTNHESGLKKFSISCLCRLKSVDFK